MTAMQELIEKMNEAPLQFASALILINSFEFLEKEKKQIKQSFNDGISQYAQYDPERHGNEGPNPEQYYNDKYSN